MELSSENQPAAPQKQLAIRLQIRADYLLWLSIGMVAGVLRFGRLGGQPLSPAEAFEAWRLWLFWSPDGSIFLEPFSPTYFSSTGLLTQIVGFSDFGVRLVPAAAGLAAVVLLYRWRSVLGDLGALLAAFWLAVSPVLIFQSRHAGGDSLALLAVVLMGEALWRLALNRESPRRPVTLLAAAAAFGLGSATLFYAALLPLALAISWTDRALSRENPDHETIFKRLQSYFAAEPRNRRQVFLTAGLVFIVSTTLFFWHLPGLGETADILAGWLAAFQTAFSAAGWENFLVAVFRHEFVLLLTALVAAAWAIFWGPPIARGLAFWFGLAFLLTGLQNSSPSFIAAIVLPSALLVGIAAERLRKSLSEKGDLTWLGAFQVAALLILLLLIVAANLGRYARISTFDPADAAHLLLAILCALITLFVWALAIVWDPPVGLAAGMITLIFAGLIVQWGIAWRVGVTEIFDGRLGPAVLTTDSEFPLLVETAAETARELRGAEEAVSIFSSIDHPLLRWYLRDFNRVQFGSTVPVETTYELVIAPETEQPAFGTDYLGSDFGVFVTPPAAPDGILNQLRRFLFGEQPSPEAELRAVLWVRSDLLIPDRSRTIP